MLMKSEKTNIALIGFMGTGKSSIGKTLAEKLGKIFVELDSKIEEKAGKSIPDIFKEGEIVFREIEMAVVKEVSAQTNLIIATGGGVILNKLNIDYLKQNAIIILLEAPAKTIFDRIMADGKQKRPLLNKPDPLSEIQTLLKFRKPFYDSAADLHINTSLKNIDQIVREILDKLSISEFNAISLKPSQTSDTLMPEMSITSSLEKVKDHCLICQKKLNLVKPSELLTCTLCNKPNLAYQVCEAGHYVCDKCFSQDVLEFLQSYCSRSQLSDPLEILKEILNYPRLTLKGPEITMVVAMTLLTAVMNRIKGHSPNEFGKVDIPRIVLALKRASIIPGIFTVYYGIDNAAVGVGLAVSVFLEATPKRSADIKTANQATAEILAQLQYGTLPPIEAIQQAIKTGWAYFIRTFKL